MLKRPVTSDDLERLRQERDAADRRYNDALTALDSALPRFPGPPAAPPGRDDESMAGLAGQADILEGLVLPPPRGLRSRLAHFIWNVVRPSFERQQAFNVRLTDRLAADLAAERAVSAAFA